VRDGLTSGGKVAIAQSRVKSISESSAKRSPDRLSNEEKRENPRKRQPGIAASDDSGDPKSRVETIATGACGASVFPNVVRRHHCAARVLVSLVGQEYPVRRCHADLLSVPFRHPRYWGLG